MKLTIHIQSYNAAFEDNHEEAANILQRLSNIVRQKGTGLHSHYIEPILDSYGNICGTMKVNK